MIALLSTTYFGPIQWYQKLYRADAVMIERCESFQKQTFRNRCIIATTQGLQALTVPVVGRATLSSPTLHHPTPITRHPSPIKDLRISDHGNWRHLHWNAIKSAYGESPFFEYYEDDLRPFFEQRWEYLLDFNEAIRQKMCELLDIHPRVSFTSEFMLPSSPSLIPHPLSPIPNQLSSITHPPSPITDYRDAIQPKHPAEDPDFKSRRYYQVYEQKHGFLPNLSILDLLMNMGPEGIFWL